MYNIRQENMKQFIEKQNVVSIRELQTLFPNVSLMTIHRDLDALEAGAIASGLSGTGSSFVAVVDNDVIDDVEESWGKYEGNVIRTKVDNDGCIEI